jgi:hypothetical protein
MTTNRESLVDKMRALLAKTRKNGCTEAEELAALAKARAMRDAYAVTDEELQLVQEGAAVVRQETPDLNDPHKIKSRLAHAVAQFSDCRIWRNSSGEFVFCGMAGDVEWASWLLDHLTDFVAAELALHLMTSLAPPSERAKVIRGFIVGCAGRINERISELCTPPAEQTNNSRALMVVKSKAIADKIAELGIKLRSSRLQCCSFDGAALQAGRKAGNQASFGPPVSGGARVQRLGK